MPAVSFSGTPVEYEQTRPRPDLVLLHSLHTDLSVFEAMLPALAERYRVTRINLPGYGASSPAPPDSVREYTDYVAAVIDALALPKQTTTVFGNGLGGLIALQLGIGYGARFDRLIVAGALGAFPAEARTSLLAIAETVRAKGMRAVLDAAMARAFSPGSRVRAPSSSLRERRASPQSMPNASRTPASRWPAWTFAPSSARSATPRWWCAEHTTRPRRPPSRARWPRPFPARSIGKFRTAAIARCSNSRRSSSS